MNANEKNLKISPRRQARKDILSVYITPQEFLCVLCASTKVIIMISQRRRARREIVMYIACSPDEAKRNPGTFVLDNGFPAFTALHPGYATAKRHSGVF